MGDGGKAQVGGKRATTRPGSRGGPRKGGGGAGDGGGYGDDDGGARGARQDNVPHQAGAESDTYDALDASDEEDDRRSHRAGDGRRAAGGRAGEGTLPDQEAMGPLDAVTGNILGFFGLSQRDDEPGRRGDGRSANDAGYFEDGDDKDGGDDGLGGGRPNAGPGGGRGGGKRQGGKSMVRECSLMCVFPESIRVHRATSVNDSPYELAFKDRKKSCLHFCGNYQGLSQHRYIECYIDNS